jgi:polar amino acid transport system substrate-binding protein
VKPRSWLSPLPLLLVAGALATWAVPGSAAVLAPPAHHLPAPVAAQAASAPAATCDPTASLRPAGPPKVTPGSFMAKIRARGYLIAGVDQSTYHFGYLNPLDGKIEGFDIDMVHAIAKAIFGNPNKVEFKAISDAQRIPEVRSGAVDIVAHTMTINCARLQQVDFSTVYYDAGQRVLVQTNSPVNSIADLGGKKVCATTGSTSIANIKAAPSHPIPVAMPYWTDCLVLLQQGDVAAISTDDSILAGLAAQDPWTKIVGPRFSNEPYGLAISQQHADFVRFVNAVLLQMRTDGQWAASYAHWVGTPAPAPPPAHYKD